MGVVTYIADKLTNIMSGMGTTVDRGVGLFYTFTPMTPEQAEASYRMSWLARKIVDVPPKDMTREWRDWQAESADIEKVEAEEKRLQLRAKCQRALVLARLYGGGALILGTRDASPEEPIAADRVKAGGLTYVHVMSRHQMTEGQPRTDPTDPWFGQPDFFTLNMVDGRQVRLHPSRVVAFIGQKAPEGCVYQDRSWFWGDPIMQSIGETVRNADLAQAGFASLIDEAKIDIIKIPELTARAATEEYERQMLTRLQAASLGKTRWQMLAIDAEEEWEQRQVTWTGIPDVMFAYLNVVAGAADIPVTRLLGVSPKGLQSTGDGEERDYHSMVKAWQDDLLAPALDQIDELLIRSALGSRPDDIYYEFAPLGHVPEKEAAEIEKTFADAAKLLADAALVPAEPLATAVQNRMVESGRWPGLEGAIEEFGAVIEEPEEADPSELQTREENVAAMEEQGTISADQAMTLIRDARPRTLYVSRKLINADRFTRWAKAQGFETTTPAEDLHVTICFSRAPVDWLKMGSPWDEDEQGRLTVKPGGARLVEALGDKGAVVLMFASSSLSWRHEEFIHNGASFDFDEYQPHITITYQAPADFDLSKVEPYRGELVFGPEVFTEVVEDWEKTVEEA